MKFVLNFSGEVMKSRGKHGREMFRLSLLRL